MASTVQSCRSAIDRPFEGKPCEKAARAGAYRRFPRVGRCIPPSPPLDDVLFHPASARVGPTGLDERPDPHLLVGESSVIVASPPRPRRRRRDGRGDRAGPPISRASGSRSSSRNAGETFFAVTDHGREPRCAAHGRRGRGRARTSVHRPGFARASSRQYGTTARRRGRAGWRAPPRAAPAERIAAARGRAWSRCDARRGSRGVCRPGLDGDHRKVDRSDRSIQ
jgi:hypothetical protein